MTITPPVSSPSASHAASSAVSESRSKGYDLKAEDFINMMITQLQNQDPTEPAKNEQLLTQMSQIGQLESSTQLQESLETLVLQSNIGASGNMIGKLVRGVDHLGDISEGVVTSVRIEDGNVMLELDNGSSVKMTNVQEITDADADIGSAVE